MEEAGYEQHTLFRFAAENGEDAAAADAADLVCDPEGVIRACREKPVDPFLPGDLSRGPGEVAGREMWSRRHEEAQESTRIERRPLDDYGEVPAGLEGVLKRFSLTTRSSAENGCAPPIRPREPYG